jgi:hypothetical protein
MTYAAVNSTFAIIGYKLELFFPVGQRTAFPRDWRRVGATRIVD